MNEDEYYLPEVRHGGRKWALRGDVSRVAWVMVHLGEREQSVTQCSGGDWWMNTHSLGKRLPSKPPSGWRTESIKHLPLLYVFSLFDSLIHTLFPPRLFPSVLEFSLLFNGPDEIKLEYKPNCKLLLLNCENITLNTYFKDVVCMPVS